MRFYSMHNDQVLCPLSQTEATLEVLQTTPAQTRAGYYVLAEDENAPQDTPDYRVICDNTGKLVFLPVSLTVH